VGATPFDLPTARLFRKTKSFWGKAGIEARLSCVQFFGFPPSSRDSYNSLVVFKERPRVSDQGKYQSSLTISIKLPETMIEELKSLANKNDVPYQSLIKIYLAERIVQETAS
jgi:hypothetical protein